MTTGPGLGLAWARLGGLALQQLQDAVVDPPPPAVPPERLPRHVAVILDGNGRWAERRGLPRIAGHEAGLHRLADIADAALMAGVPYLSAYCFSTENWTRPATEVGYLFGLLQRTCHLLAQGPPPDGIRIRWAGSTTGLPASLLSSLERVEHDTATHTGLTLMLCINYGSRNEIAHAARAVGRSIADGILTPDQIDEHELGRHLYLPDLPDVDLLIRTSGEQRISNFLLWQAAYAEIVFDRVPWPDFTRHRFYRALETYAARDRRFGGHAPPPAAEDPADPPAHILTDQHSGRQATGAATAHHAAQAVLTRDPRIVARALQPLQHHLHDLQYAAEFHSHLGPARLADVWRMLECWISPADPATAHTALNLLRVLRLSLELASFSIDPEDTWLQALPAPDTAEPSQPVLPHGLLDGATLSPRWSQALQTDPPHQPPSRTALGTAAGVGHGDALHDDPATTL